MGKKLYPDIILAFRKGNPEAFSKVYNHYHYVIYGFAFYYLKNQAEAEDIAAETFVKLWERRENFGTIDNILAFLRITTRNACLDLIKHKKHAISRKQELLYSLQQDSSQAFSDREIIAEVLGHIYREIEKLPKKTRRVVLLSLGGLKNQEIANQLNLSIQTVMNQKTNALKVLRIAILNKKLA